MKALSIRQPWAWAILRAGKDVENRSWPTGFRGRVLIHASKGCTRAEYDGAAEFIESVAGCAVPSLADLARGAIVGAVTITGCVSQSDSRWFGGPFGFVLTDPVALPAPVPCRGMLGFFDVSATVAEQIRRLAA